ncbi:hypothetical protein [Enterococcus asini]|uniref:hypothetical protein n=1 Tax=Enterococcus asini TaxID=57732 RepID=UPI0026DC3454|nr:hypothetical protein [Enterococcus asini]
MKKSEFTPISDQTALEHVKNGNRDKLYFMNKSKEMCRLSRVRLDFDEAFTVQFFFLLEEKA